MILTIVSFPDYFLFICVILHNALINLFYNSLKIIYSVIR